MTDCKNNHQNISLEIEKVYVLKLHILVIKWTKEILSG